MFMKKIINRFNIVLAFVIAVLIYSVFWFVGFSYFCGVNYECQSSNALNLLRSLVVLIPIAPLAVLFYFLREKLFWVWLVFTLLWIPYAVNYVYVSKNSGGWAIPGQAVVMLFAIVAYIVISFSMIVLFYSYVWVRNHRHRNNN